MRIAMAVAALAFCLPIQAIADDASQSEAPKPPKVKKVCRYTPPPTGSNRPGKRVCRTAEDWKEFDRATIEYDRMDQGTPVRSQGVTPPSDNN